MLLRALIFEKTVARFFKTSLSNIATQ